MVIDKERLSVDFVDGEIKITGSAWDAAKEMTAMIIQGAIDAFPEMSEEAIDSEVMVMLELMLMRYAMDKDRCPGCIGIRMADIFHMQLKKLKEQKSGEQKEGKKHLH